MQPPYTIIESDLATLRRFGDALFREHFEEIALDQGAVPLDPDWPAFTALANAGMLEVVLAFEGGTFEPLRGDERLIGYSVLVVATLMHHRNTTEARSNAVFVTKSARKTGVFDRLFEATEGIARRRGATMVTWHAKPGSNLDRIMQRRRDYRVQETLYSKVL